MNLTPLNRLLLSKSKWLLTIPVIAGSGDGQSSVWVEEWLLNISLDQSEWLLSVPVVSGGGDSEAGIWVKEWLLSLSLGLGEGKWLLTIPMVSSGSNGESGIWVEEWLGGDGGDEKSSDGFHIFKFIIFSGWRNGSAATAAMRRAAMVFIFLNLLYSLGGGL